MELLLFALRALMALALIAFIVIAARRLLIDRRALLPVTPPPLRLHSDAGRVYTIVAEAWIGRDPNCHILLADEFVSSRHARLFWDAANATWQVEDAGSRNGTQVNGVRVERQALAAGDAIGVGRARLVVDAESIPPTSARTGL